jgi:hypothetical protein
MHAHADPHCMRRAGPHCMAEWVCADKAQRKTASFAHGRFPFPVPKLQRGDLLLQSVDLLPS